MTAVIDADGTAWVASISGRYSANEQHTWLMATLIHRLSDRAEAWAKLAGATPATNGRDVSSGEWS